MAKVLNRIPAASDADYGKQTIELSGTKSAGQTGHRRHPQWSDLKGEAEILTLPELFESGLRQARPKPFLGHREVLTTEPLTFAPEFTWQTYAQVDKRRRAIGSALHDLFGSGQLTAGSDFETVGLWSINRPEWQIVDMACAAYNKVSVSLYDTLGPASVEYVMNHSEISVVFASANHLKALIDNASNCPNLKMVVSFDTLDAKTKKDLTDAGKEKGVAVKELKELETQGANKPIDPIPATLDQVATICYTSGTTATPKGVVLTHRNLSAAVISNLHGMPAMSDNFAMFSYLPLAHIYGRTFELLVACLGGRIGYFTGNPLNLLSDVQSLKPEFFPAVPRVLNRIYMSAMANTRAPGLKGILFRRAVETKLANLRSTGNNTHWLWDAIVFKKVQAVLGGRVQAITSGSAPINVDVMDFLKISLGCTIIEGYGLTETAATCARTWSKDPTATGTIGGAQMINEIKLVDVPELGYHAEDKPHPRGELLVRGANVFSRYYKDEKNTSAALDNDGWFHTGDVAELDTSGRFKIIDRIKNIMKLAQGEYVALEKVENLYTSCPVVAQVYIHGDSLQDHLLAVVVPDPVVLSLIANEVGYKFDPAAPPAVAAAIKEEKVRKAVLDAMSNQVRKNGLKGFEVAKNVHLTLEAFSVENDTMTPTFKIKRKEAYHKYKDVIDGMYAQAATARAA